MSHEVKRLSSALMRSGCASGNSSSTMYAQSSSGVPAATPASAGSPSGAAAQKAAKAGAPAAPEPNRLSRRAEMYYATALRIDSLDSKASEPGEIMRPGWLGLDADKRKPLNRRNARRPTRAIVIGWLLRPRQTGETRKPWERDYGSIPRHRLAVSLGHSVGPALKLDGAQRKVGRLGLMLYMSCQV